MMQRLSTSSDKTNKSRTPRLKSKIFNYNATIRNDFGSITKHNFSFSKSSTAKASPSTASINRKSYVILALMTGRGKLKYEVGMALIDLSYPHLILCQISDNYIFSNTLSKLNIYEPKEIIVPDGYLTDANSELSLHRSIARKLKDVNVTSIPRQHFSSLTGWELIDVCCTNESSSVKQIIKNKYYALSAASALLKYISHIQRLSYAPNSVKVEFQSCEDTVVLGIDTVEILEITNSLNPAMPNFNLYTAINKCVTTVGKKFLRSSLLQPLYNKEAIEERHECISELIDNHSLLLSLQGALRKLNNVEKLLNISINMDNYDDIKLAEKNVNYILLLKSTIDVLPEVHTILEITSASIFCRIRDNFADPRFTEIKELISELIQEDAASVQGYTSSNMQRCFAIKPKINELLDVVRQAYCEHIDSMIQYVEELTKNYSLPLTLGCNSTMGYYIQLNIPKKSKGTELNLPRELIELKKTAATVMLTTEKLQVDSEKCKEICEEIHIMSNVLLEQLIEKIREFINCFFQLCKDVSELDFLASLATISCKQRLVQPKFGNKLCIIGSYHPIKFLLGHEDSVSNNIVASVLYNFHIITGPNLSGKTTYLKQVLVLHILAQIGCYIPAEKAELRLTDRFFFHSSNYVTDDSMSTFEFELRGLSYIMNFATHHSLIALDEPCMTTSTQDGTCLAVAICVKIADTKAFSFCATHHLYLTRLAENFYNVTNLHFNCYPKMSQSSTLVYTHELKLGVTPIKNYGIAAAKLSWLPKSIIENAEKIAKKLSHKEIEIQKCDVTFEASLTRKCYFFASKVYHLIVDDQFTIPNVVDTMKDIFTDDLIQNFESHMNKSILYNEKVVAMKAILKKCVDIKNRNEEIMSEICKNSNTAYDVCISRLRDYGILDDSNNFYNPENELDNEEVDYNASFIPCQASNSTPKDFHKQSEAVTKGNSAISESEFQQASNSTPKDFHKQSEAVTEGNSASSESEFRVDLFYQELLERNLSLRESNSSISNNTNI